MFATPACFSSFFFLCFGDHRDLHSFPTRRSSDLSELEACLKRRGEATAAFLDEQPTYRLFPPLYYYIGRAQEGLKSRSEEHTSELQSLRHLVCRLLLEKKKKKTIENTR